MSQSESAQKRSRENSQFPWNNKDIKYYEFDYFPFLNSIIITPIRPAKTMIRQQSTQSFLGDRNFFIRTTRSSFCSSKLMSTLSILWAAFWTCSSLTTNCSFIERFSCLMSSKSRIICSSFLSIAFSCSSHLWMTSAS